MKNVFYILVSVAFFSCNNKEGKLFEVEGTIKNSNAKMVYLEEIPFNGSQPIILDSVVIKDDGVFHLKATSKGDGLYSIRTAQKQFPFALVISDASKITIDADANNQAQPYTVKGSAASQSLLVFDKTISSKAIALFQLGSRMDSLSKIKAPDSITSQQYAQVEVAVKDLKNYAADFLNKSTNPALTLYAMDSYQAMTTNIGIKGFNETEVANIINSALAKFPKSTILEEVKKKLPQAKSAEFTLPDVNGKPVSLSSFKGKYVLVDFWASWCAPCRQENPNIVKTYNQFKDKNFTILGVSLDKDKSAWQDAIKNDGLVWTHVSDLKFWESQVVQQFRISSIPYNFLVDPNGNIIAEDLHGEELVRTLSTALK